jgi:ribosomal protein L19E
LKVKKPLVIAGAVSSIGLASILGVGAVSAATSNTANGGNTLVDKIASTFHLNKDDVQKVFDQNRADHEAQANANVESELTQLVKDGKITDAQKSAILAKRTELQQQRDADKDSMKDKTPDERKAAMDAKRAELEKWVSDNGLTKNYLRYVVGGHGHMGHDSDND